MSPMKREALVLAINKLFQSDWFSISKAEQIVKLTGGIVNEEVHDCWELLHCVHYNQMSPNTRESLFNSVLSACNTQGFLKLGIYDNVVSIKHTEPVLIAKIEDRL